MATQHIKAEVHCNHNIGAHCDALARLPISDAVESLNVSNAAAVALYAVATRS